MTRHSNCRPEQAGGRPAAARLLKAGPSGPKQARDRGPITAVRPQGHGWDSEPTQASSGSCHRAASVVSTASGSHTQQAPTLRPDHHIRAALGLPVSGIPSRPLATSSVHQLNKLPPALDSSSPRRIDLAAFDVKFKCRNASPTEPDRDSKQLEGTLRSRRVHFWSLLVGSWDPKAKSVSS